MAGEYAFNGDWVLQDGTAFSTGISSLQVVDTQCALHPSHDSHFKHSFHKAEPDADTPEHNKAKQVLHCQSQVEPLSSHTRL